MLSHRNFLLLFLPSLIGLLIAFGPDRASAQDTPEIARTDDGLEKESSMFHLGANLGFGAIDEDYLLNVDINLVFELDKWSFGVAAPLRFVVVDEAPDCNCVIREEDWDELNDYMRIIRFVQYGKPAEGIYARIGELNATSIGHGTAVDRYYNVVDINHYKFGFRANIDLDYGGFEILIDSLTSKPSLVALRPFVRPFTFFDVDPILKGLTTGLVFAADFFAPLEIQTNADGTPRLSEHDFLQTQTTDTVAVYGIDLDWQFIMGEWLALIPYFDLLALNDLGAGTHLGLFANFHLPMDMRIDTRGEWRYTSARYEPTYFNSLYEIERWSFFGAPKLFTTKNRDDSEGRHGFIGSIDFRIANLLTIGVSYEDYMGPNNSSFIARAKLPDMFGIRATAFYTKRNFDSLADLATLEDAMLAGVIGWNFWGPIGVSAEYARQWQINDEGQYETTNTWNVGLGAEFHF